MFQWAVPSTCQMPFRSGLRSGVRGPLYEVGGAAAGRGDAPRCASARPAIPNVSKARLVAVAMVATGFFIADWRESTRSGQTATRQGGCRPPVDGTEKSDDEAQYDNVG